MGLFRRKAKLTDQAATAAANAEALELIQFFGEHRTRLAELGIEITDEELSELRGPAVQGSCDPDFLAAIDAMRDARAALSAPITLTISGVGIEQSTTFDLLHLPPTADGSDSWQPPEGMAAYDDPIWKRLEQIGDRYFGACEQGDMCRRNGDFKGALSAAMNAINELPDLVDANCGAYGRWDIRSSTAVDLLARYLPLQDPLEFDARGCLEDARKVMATREQLADWDGQLALAADDISLVASILELAGEEPGVVQSRLGKRLGVDGRHAATVCRDLGILGRLVRLKSSTSYALYLPGAAPEGSVEHDTAPRPVPVPPKATVPASSAAHSGVLAQPSTQTERAEPHDAYASACASGAGGFVAIDFETATAERTSACAIAAAVVEGGRVIEVRRWLIRPPGNDYEAFNIAIHGITPEQTANAPGFAERWVEVDEFIGDRPIVAHYAPFDISVLRASMLAFDAPVADHDYLCTVSLTRRIWPGWYSYSLPIVAGAIGLDLEHHVVESDAAAAAGIALACCGAFGAPTLSALADELGVFSGTVHGGPMRWQANGTPLSRLTPRGEVSEDELIAGATIVFTGTLLMPRREAAQLAVDHGAQCASNVSRKVDYLVCGVQDLSRTVSMEGSSKLLKARDLAEAGHPIEIISEVEFFRMLGARREGTSTS